MLRFRKVFLSRGLITIILWSIQLLFYVLIGNALIEYSKLIHIICYILSITLAIYILSMKNGNLESKLPWIILILLFPVFGSLFYFLFRNQKVRKKVRKNIESQVYATQKISHNVDEIYEELKNKNRNVYNQSQYIYKTTNMPIYKNTECTYFKSGEDYFESFVEELKKAKKFIFMETFILRQGKMWTTVFNILKAKAKEGVEIRFMYDDFGCINDIPINYKKHIEKYGIKCEVFNPIYPITTLAHNNRDHRKIVVIDGVIGYTGGANLADEYININSRFGHWKDSAIMIKGEAVKSFTLMFLETWHVFRDKDEDYSPFLSDIQLKEPSNSKKTKKAKKSKKSSQEMTKQISIFENIATVSKNNEFVQPYMTTPMDDEEIVARNVYVNILNSATEYVYITTPYLILDPELEEALLNAAKRSVDVRIITPGIPDKKYVFAVTRSEYYNLLKAGIKIYEYTPGFIHAKNVVADDMIATVGSINFDNRSFYHNYENGVLVYNSPVIADIKKDFLDTQKLSKQIEIEYNEKTPIRVKIKTAICRVLIPLI